MTVDAVKMTALICLTVVLVTSTVAVVLGLAWLSLEAVDKIRELLD